MLVVVYKVCVQMYKSCNNYHTGQNNRQIILILHRKNYSNTFEKSWKDFNIQAECTPIIMNYNVVVQHKVHLSYFTSFYWFGY